MHSSRMRTTRSLTISHCKKKTEKKITHAPPQITHAPPKKLRTPEKITHAPRKNYACPPEKITHAPPGKPRTSPPPPVNRITHTCKNITFPQLRLRAVITGCIECDCVRLRLIAHSHNAVTAGNECSIVIQ